MGAIWHTSNRWRINELEDIDTTSSKMFADITDNPDAFPHEANIWYWYDGGWTESNDIHVSLFPEGKSQLRFLYNRLALVIHCDSHLSSIPLPWQLFSIIKVV